MLTTSISVVTVIFIPNKCCVKGISEGCRKSQDEGISERFLTSVSKVLVEDDKRVKTKALVKGAERMCQSH